MKHLTGIWKVIEEITERDGRYKENAYSFVMAALEKTISRKGAGRHVTGQELLEDIRSAATEQFGPMAKEILNFWGIERTEDFGEIVFNLIDAGLLSKTEKDSREDFSGGYDFKKIFEDDYYGG